MPILQNDIDPTWQDGINLTDTFDVWRKKTNGHIEAYKPIITNDDIADLTIQSIKLAPPAPSWDTQGTVTTNGAVGAFIVKGGFTSGSASSINVASAASSSSALEITSSTRVLRFNPNSTIGEKNPLVAVGDYSIIAGSSNSDTQNIIIGKWSNSSHGVVIGQGKVGINRVATTNAFEVQGAISATTSITGTSLSAGSGTISTTGAISGGAIICTSLSAGSGDITTSGAISGGAITCTSLNAGSGDITTSGKIKSSAITLNNNQLNAVPAQTLALSYASALDGSTTTAYNTVIYNGAGVAAVTITGSSKAVAFAGAVNGITALDVTGDIKAGGNIIAYATSDRKFKDNIKNITDALDKVSKINGVSFDWNDKQTTFTGSDIGVIAQEVESVLPEIVATREDGSKAVKYEKMVALLVECVKELKSEIEELKLLIK